MEFYLTSKSLKRIKDSGIDNDFKIKIFEDSIKCSTFVALYLSSEISKQYRNDPTTNEFIIQFPESSAFYSSHEELKSMIQRTSFINKFDQFLCGEPILISDEKTTNSEPNTSTQSQKGSTDERDTAKLIFEIGQILGNKEMIEIGLKILVQPGIKKEQTAADSIEMLLKFHELGIEDIPGNLFDLIASNLYKIITSPNGQEEGKVKQNFLKKMSRSDLEEIFSSKKLQIDSEDTLFEYITSLGSEFFYLYDYVEIQFLSVENVERLIFNIENYEVPLHNLLWSSICRRLLLDVSKINDKRNPRCIFPPSTNCETEGIIKHLQKSSNDNVYESKTIDVIVSGIDGGEIKNLFDHSTDTILKANSKDSKNSYVIVDFKDKKVNVSKYYLSVPSQKANWVNDRPYSWRIEGSNDKENWEKIDERLNNSSLKYYGASNTFDVTERKNKFYRYIRIFEITSQDNSHLMLLSEIEFYGLIQDKQ